VGRGGTRWNHTDQIKRSAVGIVHREDVETVYWCGDFADRFAGVLNQFDGINFAGNEGF
jgi:hypothetical protein